MLANRTPTVKAIATGGTFFAKGDASTTDSNPLMIWYRVLEDTARNIPGDTIEIGEFEAYTTRYSQLLIMVPL